MDNAEEKYLYGKVIADAINEETRVFIEQLKAKHRRLPKIKVLLANDSPASLSYIAGFEKLCVKVGMDYEICTVAQTCTTETLCERVKGMNEDTSVDGILLQMPLPKQVDAERVIDCLAWDKDVDGFHPVNVGRLRLGMEAFVPCTAASVMAFLEHSGIDLNGKHVVVLGRSQIVGKPVAELCLAKHATVTICHSRTRNIEQIAAQADVLIAAVGRARLVKRSWVKEGAVVIDVGVNRDENGKLCGDVDLEDVLDRVSKISPVPKGVGVVTNAMLLKNAIMAYQRHEKGSMNPIYK